MMSHVGEVAVVLLFLIGCVAVVSILQYLARRFTEEEERPKFKVARGAAVGTLEQARRDLDSKARSPEDDPRTIPHGGLVLTRSEETKHKAVIGATGTGKSLTMLADLNAILPRVVRPLAVPGLGGEKEVVSVVLYDDKRELPAFVAGLVGEGRMKLLNPFDLRGVSVNVALLFDTETRAARLAEIYVPKGINPESQPYFNNASRDLIVAAVAVFNRLAPGKWTLRDLHEAFETMTRLKFVLTHTARGRSLVTTHLGNEATALNVMSNTQAAIRDFRPLAAVWERATGSIDLKRTIREGGNVLVLQPSEEHFAASRAANRLILTLILQFALDFPDSDLFRLFCLLDEVQELGRIEILPRATSVIRSKGGCLLYYTQLLDSFYKEYGEHDSHKILDNIPTKAVFAVHGRTARWASEQFGQIEIERYVETKDPNDEEAKSKTQQYQRTDAVFAGEVSGIAPPSPERGLSGLYRTRLTRPYFSTVRNFDRLLPRPLPGVAGFVPRPAEDEVMAGWDESDLARLGLTLGPDDDVEAILGTKDEEAEGTGGAPNGEAPDAQDDGIFGKLKNIFRKGDDQ